MSKQTHSASDAGLRSTIDRIELLLRTSKEADAFDLAKTEWQRVINGSPQSIEGLYLLVHLGRILHRRGDSSHALGYLARFAQEHDEAPSDRQNELLEWGVSLHYTVKDAVRRSLGSKYAGEPDSDLKVKAEFDELCKSQMAKQSRRRQNGSQAAGVSPASSGCLVSVCVVIVLLTAAVAVWVALLT